MTSCHWISRCLKTCCLSISGWFHCAQGTHFCVIVLILNLLRWIVLSSRISCASWIGWVGGLGGEKNVCSVAAALRRCVRSWWAVSWFQSFPSLLIFCPVILPVTDKGTAAGTACLSVSAASSKEDLVPVQSLSSWFTVPFIIMQRLSCLCDFISSKI